MDAANTSKTAFEDASSRKPYKQSDEHHAGVVIDCGNGSTATLRVYEDKLVSFDGKRPQDSAEIYFDILSTIPGVGGKRGEDFVKAVLAVKNNGVYQCTFEQDGQKISQQALDGNGFVTQQAYFKKGKPCQGPNGEHGLVAYYGDTKTLFCTEDYDKDGLPAERKQYYKNEQLELRTLYRNGKTADYTTYNEEGKKTSHHLIAADGSTRKELYGDNGLLSDPRHNGMVLGPALEITAADGKIAREYYRDGVKVEAPSAQAPAAPKRGGIKGMLSRFRLH